MFLLSFIHITEREKTMPRRRGVTRKEVRAPHWDAHESVLIRSLREQDNETIQDELASMVGTENANMKLALGTTRKLTMLHGIESWTLTEEDGRPIAKSLEAIGNLAPEDADFIYAEINKLNQPMTADEKKAS